MSRITTIENAIIQLSPGDYQRFCDALLSKMEKFESISSLGMQAGTSNTTIGNPDTYFRKENGKYIFAAYTKQRNDIYGKLKGDIEKCLDPLKTGIQLCDIEEIVCCHTSSNVTAGQEDELYKLCEGQGVKLIILGIDEMARLVSEQYPILARDYLSLCLNTDQIMTVSGFIDKYDSSETVAPLNTVFLCREKELVELEEAISRNRAVIVHGSAGVGKTRLVIEAIKRVSKAKGYELLCIKNNNQPIYEDLIEHTGKPGKYLIFIDDANELAELNLIMDRIVIQKPDYEFRLIVTVRDYVKKAWNN